MAQYLKHKRSSVVINGKPKLPTTANLNIGEIAINFADGYETLAIVNNNSEIVTFSSDEQHLTAISAATSGLFSTVSYNSQAKRIYFYDKDGVQASTYVDATDFIKDGMVSSVTVSNGNLVISFNTDAGREDIELELTEIFNPNNYYDKDAADAKFLSGFTESDPTVPSWAKAANKPSYTAAEVGALPDTTDVPTEAKIINSGFTKNAGTITGIQMNGYSNCTSGNVNLGTVVTAITINNTPATITNGAASATVDGLPSVTSTDNGKILQVVNGQWSAVTPSVIYSGNAAPQNSMGNDGDIYLQA